MYILAFKIIVDEVGKNMGTNLKSYNQWIQKKKNAHLTIKCAKQGLSMNTEWAECVWYLSNRLHERPRTIPGKPSVGGGLSKGP